MEPGRVRQTAYALLALAAAGFVASLALFPYGAHASSRPYILTTGVTTVVLTWGVCLLVKARWRRIGVAFASVVTVWTITMSIIFFVLVRR